jgi:hypothetical protein
VSSFIWPATHTKDDAHPTRQARTYGPGTAGAVTHRTNTCAGRTMYLRIKVHCPLCVGEPEWIYDTDTDQKHRGAMGCPGGCTAIQDIGIRQISEEDAKEFISNERYPKNNLDL